MEIGFWLVVAVFGLLLIMIASGGGKKQPVDPAEEPRDSRRQPLILRNHNQPASRSSRDDEDYYYEEPWTREQYDQRWQEIFDEQRRGHEIAVQRNAEYAARTQEIIDARLQREADQARRDGDWYTHLGK